MGELAGGVSVAVAHGRCKWQVIHDTQHVTPDMWHVSPNTWHVTHDRKIFIKEILYFRFGIAATIHTLLEHVREIKQKLKKTHDTKIYI